MISFVPNTIEDTVFREKLIFEAIKQRRKLAEDDGEFTRSCVFQSTSSKSRHHGYMGKEDFTRSVHVVSTGKGHYTVYQPPTSADHRHYRGNDLPSFSGREDGNIYSSRTDNFVYNISNPELRKVRKKPHSDLESVYSAPGSTKKLIETIKEKETGLTQKRHKSRSLEDLSDKSDFMPCSCKSYHSHTFAKPRFFIERDRSHEQEKFELSLAKTRSDLIEANDKHFMICNTFWRPSLSIHQFVDGDPVIPFASLWQEEASLKELLRDGIQNTVLRSAISELTLLAVASGPLHLLKSLIDLSLVRVDSVLEDGAGLLHHACLFRRPEIIQYLTSEGVSPHVKDRQGNTADQFCFCTKTWKSLPTKYHIQSKSTSRGSTSQLLQPSMQDKDVIFRMAESAKALYELQKKLQIFEFNVNTECNGNGDFLIHVAAQGGLCQLPLIMLLQRIQGADIELCNSRGMTPLMIAAQEGDAVLCDILICLFQASTNKCNVHSGKSALHYAAQNNKVDTVSCLIRRGADFNKEDHIGCRPDDPHSADIPQDCLSIIAVQREQRCQHLSQLTKQGKLTQNDILETDLNVTDGNGFTLLMVAALYNRYDCISIILDISKSVKDAQFVKPFTSESDMRTGMTATAMAAHKGHEKCVKLLLEKGGNPSISDVLGHMPLHHAVEQNKQDVVEVILEFFPKTYVGLYTAMDPRICKKSTIRKILQQAWKKRQDEIVLTDLLECAMSGKAEQLYQLLEEGDNLNSESGVGNWPLYLAAEYGHLDVVKLFCERGADIRKKHLPTGSTALHVAAKMGHQDVVEYLLRLNLNRKNDMEKNKHPAASSQEQLDINSVNVDNKTPLQLAAEQGQMRIVKLLLNYGATTALLDQNGVLFSVPEYGGVWSEIEFQRKKHTDMVMRLIKEKSKKSMQELYKIWQPRYDHNLRDRHGDTPLMVACIKGNVEAVDLLLKSAVYQLHSEEQLHVMSDDRSDGDSGVQDSATCHSDNPKSEDGSEEDQAKYTPGFTQLSSGQIIKGTNTVVKSWLDKNRSRPPSSLETLLQDVEKPKGLSIYHKGLVSHVTAINLFDSSTPLHRCLEGGDNSTIADKILKTDVNCVNMQNSAGLSPLHLACQLNRKKCLEKILMVEELDINLYTLIGQLPEEMTNNKNIIKMVQKSRKGHPVRQRSNSSRSVASSLPDSEIFNKAPSTQGSTINLEKVHQRFESFRSNHTKAAGKVGTTVEL